MRSTVYLGVSNRRTDPLVYISNQDSLNYNLPSYYHTGYNFIPTAEFDSLVNFGSPFYLSKDSLKEKNRLYFTDLWWKRLGAREITIPFVYSATTEMNFAVKVTELCDTNWYSKEPYNNLIDTTIYLAGDSPKLVMNLLPGQSKILKVSILKAVQLSGEIPYSAQNKMVVYPVHQTSQKDFSYKDSSVYYHLVYQKYDSTRKAYNIFYRRSLPTYPNDKGTNIQWEPTEYLVSRTYKVTPYIEPVLNEPIYLSSENPFECKYPSITVRYDNVNNAVMAYIVYNCKSKSLENVVVDTLKNYIVETVFPANYSEMPDIPDTSNVIAFAYRGEPYDLLSRWGVPTINASYSGNYYSWADSIRGIMVGWKAPDDRTEIVNQSVIKTSNINIKELHPNLNTYSRMSVEEDQCSLVWEEDQPTGNNIYYTRISKVSGVITPSIYSSRIDTTVNAFNSAIRLPSGNPKYAILNLPGDGTGLASFPSVHKPVAYKLRTGYEIEDSLHYARNGWDRVTWMYNDTIETHKVIAIKAIDYSDSLHGENYPPTSYVISLGNRIIHPFITQGNINKDQSAFHTMVGRDSSLILLFTEQDNIGNDNIYQLNMNFWSNFKDPTWGIKWVSRQLDIGDTASVNQSYLHYLGNGIYPHAANSPITNKEKDFWLTKMVYQNGKLIEEPKPKVSYKGINNEKEARQFIGFSSPDSTISSGITPFVFEDGSNLAIHYGQIGTDKKLYLYDTLTTDWFQISDIKKMGFNFYSMQGRTMKLYLQRERDKKLFALNPYLLVRKVKRNIFTFLNGQNENYRIIIVKNNSLNCMQGNIIIGTKYDFLDRDDFNGDEQSYKTSAEDDHIINLNPNEEFLYDRINVNIYPNPAKEEMYVVCYLPQNEVMQGSNSEKMNIKLYNSMGQEMYSKEITAGQLIRIQTSNLKNGAYFVKATLNDNNTTIPAATKSIIIQK